MGPGAHLQLGFLTAHMRPLPQRDRRLVMLAGVLPDIDGLGLVACLWGGDQYRWFDSIHHTFGHNIFFLLLVPLLLSRFAAGNRRQAYALCLVSIAIHFLADNVAVDYEFNLLWPFGEDQPNLVRALGFSADTVKYWVQGGATLLVGALTGLCIWRFRRTPIELVSPRLDAFIVRFFTLLFTARCETDGCGNRATYACASCGKTLCGVHGRRARGLEFTCHACETEPGGGSG